MWILQFIITYIILYLHTSLLKAIQNKFTDAHNENDNGYNDNNEGKMLFKYSVLKILFCKLIMCMFEAKIDKWCYNILQFHNSNCFIIVAPSNLNFILSVGMGIYITLSKFQTDCMYESRDTTLQKSHFAIHFLCEWLRVTPMYRSISEFQPSRTHSLEHCIFT